MTCKVCGKNLDFFNVHIDKDTTVHTDCFFNETIPNIPSDNDEMYAEKMKTRKIAIELRVEEIKNM